MKEYDYRLNYRNGDNDNTYKVKLQTQGIEINDMWKKAARIRDIDGIEGYNTPIIHIDPRKEIEKRKFKELEDSIIFKKGKFPDYKKFDNEGNQIIPIKKNVFEEEAKKYDYIKKDVNEKFPELIDKFYPKEKIKQPKVSISHNMISLYKSDRITFLSDMVKKINNDNKIPENKIEAVDKVKDKLLSENKKLDYYTSIKLKYSSKGSISKDIRSSFIEEGMYIGEKSAFYHEKKDEEDKKNICKFNPSKIKVLPSSPKYSFRKLNNNNDLKEKLEFVNDKIQEKQNSIKDKWETKNIKFPGGIRESYDSIKNRGRILFSYKKDSEVSDQLVQYRESKKSPSPNKYFMTKKFSILGKSQVEDENEKLYVDRKRIDKFIYKPMRNNLT